MTKPRSHITHINKLLAKAKNISTISRTRNHLPVRTTASNLFSQPQRLFYQTSYDRISAKTHERSITTVHDLAGLHDIFTDAKKSGSPWHGAIISETGTLARLYDQATTENTNHNTALMLKLFHKLENEFRVTRHKANPAFALTPRLLAKIIYHLEHGSINDPEIKKTIANEWATIYLEKANYKKAQNADADTKVGELLDLIISAKNESLQNGVLPNLTETILLGFLYHKANSRDEMLQYIQARHELAPSKTRLTMINAAQNSKLNDEQLNSLISQLKDSGKKLSSHPRYIELIAAITSRLAVLKPVESGKYSYKAQPVRPNCTETAFHNLCNVLLLNQATERFDLTLLPASVKLHPGLISMYRAQEGTAEINSRQVCQQFMDILSDSETLVYTKDKNYEVSAITRNIIPILNIMFGCNATSLQEISTALSDERRQVWFKLTDDKLTVTITPKNHERIDCSLTFTAATAESPRHCSFDSSIFEKSHLEKLISTLLTALPVKRIVEDQLLFPIIVNIIHLSSDHNLKQLLDKIKTPEQCLLLLMNIKLDSTDLGYTNTCRAELIINACMPYALNNKTIALTLSLLTHKFHDQLLQYSVCDGDITKFTSLMNLNLQCSLHISDMKLYNYLFDVNTTQMVDTILTYASDSNIINNAITENGYTPLAHAVSRNNVELAKRFIELGANVNRRDIYGMTPLDKAISEPMIRLLLENNAIVENMYQVEKILHLLSVNEKMPFLTSHKHLIHSANDLKLAINSLSFNPTAKMDFIYSIKDKITDPTLLSVALNNLPCEKRMEFATSCIDQVGIDDNDNFHQCLLSADSDVMTLLIDIRRQHSPAPAVENRRPR